MCYSDFNNPHQKLVTGFAVEYPIYLFKKIDLFIKFQQLHN